MRERWKGWFQRSRGVRQTELVFFFVIVPFQNWPSLDDIVAVDSVSSYVPRFVMQSALVVPQFHQLYNHLINHADVFCAVGRCVAEANSRVFFVFLKRSVRDDRPPHPEQICASDLWAKIKALSLRF